MTDGAATFDIAPLRPERYAEAADFWVASWSEEMPEIDFAARRDWLIEHLTALAGTGVVVDAAFDAEDRCVGFITLDRAKGYIDQLAVSVAAKGAGAAAALLAHARQLSPALLELHVNETNPRARAFYTRQGFVEVGRGASPRTGLPVVKLRWTSGTLSQQAAQQQ